MKIRNGFVSNSSSSSFTCAVCGEDHSGMDLCLSECEMFECENGHIFHEACVKDVNLDSPEIRKAYMLDVLKKSIENCTKYLEEGSSREYYTRRLADSKSELAQLEAGEFDEDTIYDMCDEWEFRYSAPEGVCPVCTMQTFRTLTSTNPFPNDLHHILHK